MDLTNELTRLRSAIDRKEGERNRALETLKTKRVELAEAEILQADLREATEVAQAVAKVTQEELAYRVTELVSLALEAVFPDPYVFHLDFESKRGRSEARLSLSKGKDGERVDAVDATGGGVVDVTSFALRVALWSMKRPRTRATMILDEPYRFVSQDYQPRVGALLKEVSERLGLQFLIVTHEKVLVDQSDVVFDSETV